MTLNIEYLYICPRCLKAVGNEPVVGEGTSQCPYCGIDIQEAIELKLKGEWVYERR